MRAKKACLISVVHPAAINSNCPFICTWDSEKLERHTEYCFILFAKPNGPLPSSGCVEYITMVLRRFKLKQIQTYNRIFVSIQDKQMEVFFSTLISEGTDSLALLKEEIIPVL